MASFIEELWNGVFIPGASPTLLVATNATFAALQLLLLVLLLVTYSIHFIILSFLCASLWWSINWFVAEVTKAQAKEAAGSQGRKGGTGRLASGRDTTESETETEGAPGGDVKLAGSVAAAASAGSPPAGSMRSQPAPTRASGTASGLSTSQGTEEARQRQNLTESSGYISTDSEWEKVDEKIDNQ